VAITAEAITNAASTGTPASPHAKRRDSAKRDIDDLLRVIRENGGMPLPESDSSPSAAWLLVHGYSLWHAPGMHKQPLPLPAAQRQATLLDLKPNADAFHEFANVCTGKDYWSP
jgi:hypothetical protein